MFGNVDAYQIRGIRSTLKLGHGRSPLWCGSQNHHRDPKPGYGRLLAILEPAQAPITVNTASFPTCHGPEYISGKLLIWAEKHRVIIQHIQPGQPQKNVYIERYNRTVRREWLDQYIIEASEEAQDHATQWLWTYNNNRLNMGIGGITPAMKLKMAA
jgi:putative transposase